MRRDTDIQDRIRGTLVMELDRRVAEAARRLPVNCVHNHRQLLDTRKMIDGEPNSNYNSTNTSQNIGLCMFGAGSPEDWKGDLCEDAVDARRCPYFQVTLGKQEVWDRFAADLRDPVWIEQNMPTVAALLWVLEAASPPTIPWWKRLLYRMMRFNVEPLRPSVDPAQLLPGGSEKEDGS